MIENTQKKNAINKKNTKILATFLAQFINYCVSFEK